MKQIAAMLVLAVALAGCSGAEDNSNDAAPSSSSNEANEPLALEGSVAYYRAELLKIGIRDFRTDDEVFDFGRLVCSWVDEAFDEMVYFGATVKAFEQDDVFSDDPEGAAELWLTARGRQVGSPANVAGFRNAFVEGLTGPDGDNIEMVEAEIWAEQAVRLGRCYRRWTQITEYAQS